MAEPANDEDGGDLTPEPPVQANDILKPNGRREPVRSIMRQTARQTEPMGSLVTAQEVSGILGIKKESVRALMRLGKLHSVGKDDAGRTLFDKAEVETLAGERASKKLDRSLSGPERETRALARQAGLDPDNLEASSKELSEKALAARRHEELLHALGNIERGLSVLIDLFSVEKESYRELVKVNESISEIKTGAAIAAIVTGVAAVLPDSVKQKFKDAIAVSTAVEDVAVVGGSPVPEKDAVTAFFDAELLKIQKPPGTR